jgi:glycosyltransferase involved in cell wall biosynthesis
MKSSLNICLVNTNDITGGAAKAAYRLHKGLQLRNINSAMVVRNKKSTDAGIFALDTLSDADSAEQKVFSAMQKHLINNNRTDVSDTIFSLPYPGCDLSGIDVVRKSDIINLHWINYFQSVESIAALLSLGKPVVWTLHDQWAFTGGCHYSAGCQKYTQHCEQCPQLLDNSTRLTELVLKNKLNYFDSSLVIVSPSSWLAKCARKSTLFKNCRVDVIPNGLDIDIFKPTAKVKAKRDLGINPEATTMLFGAISHTKKRKGFQQLCEAIDFCRRNEKFAELIRTGKVRMITFGAADSSMRQVGIPAFSLGYIDSDKRLALVYSAADFLVLPSLEENLPNIMVECLSCGTPVIAFETGGIPEAVRHGQTGYLAAAFNTDEMGRYILNLIFRPEIRKRMSVSARELAESNFSLQVQTDRYLKLFSDLLRGRSSSGSDSLSTQHEKCSPSLSSIDPVFFTLYRRFVREVIAEDNQALRPVYNSPFAAIASIGGEVAKKIGRPVKQWIKHIL